jgi:phage tail-like protein
MGDRSFAAGRFAFGIDGQFAGFIKKCSGGTIKGEVATHKLGTTNFERKHITTISHEPLTFEVSMGMGKGLWDWIKASWDQGFVQKNAELQACNFNHEVMAVRVFQDAYVKKVTIPALAGDSKEAGYFTIELHPRIIRYEKGTGAKIQGAEDVGSKKWMCSNFRLEIDGLPCERVAKIDSFSWEQKVVHDHVGLYRESQLEPAALTIPNLKLTISMADYWAWYEWFKSFLIEGKCTDADEKSGALTFLGPDLTEELGSISFAHLGILSLEQEAVEANAESVARFTVELYCEEMFFDVYNAS